MYKKHSTIAMRNFVQSGILTLIIGSAAALASIAPAQALVFNVNGTNYDVSTVTETYSSASAQLSTTPWYGNSTLAASLSQAVYGSALGGQAAGTEYPTLIGTPIFVTDTYTYSANTYYEGQYVQTDGFQRGASFATNDPSLETFAVMSPATVPFDIPGGATIPALGSVLALGILRKARKFTSDNISYTATKKVN